MSLLSCGSCVESLRSPGVPDRGSECFEDQEVAFYICFEERVEAIMPNLSSESMEIGIVLGRELVLKCWVFVFQQALSVLHWGILATFGHPRVIINHSKCIVLRAVAATQIFFHVRSSDPSLALLIVSDHFEFDVE
jgi:hypothetical protein